LDHSGFRDVTARVVEVMTPRGSLGDWARHLPFLMRQLDLEDARADATFPYFSGASPLAEFWKISWGRVRDDVAAAGSDVSAWDRELAELDDRERLFVGPMTVSVTGRKIRDAAHGDRATGAPLVSDR
jgi:hypothetical protein